MPTLLPGPMPGLMPGLFISALEATFTRPAWWAVAGAGFLARGGIALYLLLLVDPPTPVTVTFIFGVDSVTGSGGLSERFVTTVAVLALVAFALSVAATVIAAWADATLHEGLRRDPPMEGWGPLRRVLAVSWLQSLGLIPALAAIVLALPALRDAVVGELLLPSATDVPFLIRVLLAAQGPLLRVLVAFALVEVLVTVATRTLLAARGRRSALDAYRAAAGWLLRQAPRALAAWTVGWAVLGGALVAGLGAVALAWEPVRAAFLDPSLGQTEAAGIADLLGVSALFVLVWVVAMVATGLASAFRATLWTLAVGVSLDPAGAYDGARWPG